MQIKRAIVRHTGGPEAIEFQDVELPDPGPDQALVRHQAVGLNFIDTYHRSGLYPVDLPAPLGSEMAGVVEAVGADVGNLKVGDRVAGLGPTRGAYATGNLVPARELMVLPDAIDARTAAAVALKGMTVEMLADRVAPLKPGEWALVHAAAGGVGSLLTQWLAARGVRVIGTASTAEKRARIRQWGAELAIDSRADDLADQVRAATDGAGVRASYDGVGADSWRASLDAVGRRGVVVSFGNASGPVTGVALGDLAKAGSLFVTRPSLFDYVVEQEERDAAARRLWAMIADGTLEVEIGQTYQLEEAASAHRDLEARRTSGSTLLLP